MHILHGYFKVEQYYIVKTNILDTNFGTGHKQTRALLSLGTGTRTCAVSCFICAEHGGQAINGVINKLDWEEVEATLLSAKRDGADPGFEVCEPRWKTGRDMSRRRIKHWCPGRWHLKMVESTLSKSLLVPTMDSAVSYSWQCCLQLVLVICTWCRVDRVTLKVSENSSPIAVLVLLLALVPFVPVA
ncbi:hypothetical protein PPTG_20816 [Phytophthora nicotianae INRA-310]|uniref:Uncharacterized protein n=1 Tax=Phytophthora nicotianae (strain INRA-310) TaxID=761204 RepID=W2RJG5_PHYN3|nr:hypothetical protein PPTG_20816 [Phytophthora nicotianae INRA-310]ETN24755.1 hypothetical protein PPTG_20816 [Phytophthora nicotianae INRA-310]